MGQHPLCIGKNIVACTHIAAVLVGRAGIDTADSHPEVYTAGSPPVSGGVPAGKFLLASPADPQ